MPNLLAAIAAASILLAASQSYAAEPVVVIAEAIISGAKQPQVVVDEAGTVFVAFGAGQDIYICKSVDGAKTYSQPIRVAHVPGLALGMRRGPRIVASNGWLVISAISHESGELLSWRSDDGGELWSEATNLVDAKDSAREGLHAMTVGPNGMILVAWLDHRHEGAQIFGSVSKDGGRTWKPNHQIYVSPSGTVCECCHPSVAIGPSNEIYVMWRNSIAGNRDMYVTRSDDEGQTYAEASKLGAGTWRLNACPMDGGDLAVDEDGTLLTVWRRDKTLYTAGVDQGDEVMLALGEQPCVAAGGKSGYLAWVERRGGPLRLSQLGSTKSTVLAREALDPSMVSFPQPNNAVVVVWEGTNNSRRAIMSVTIDD
jgi:hypothetical protein